MLETSVKEQLYIRANNCCEYCGISNEKHLQKTGTQLVVHHYLPCPVLENVKLVCIKCHRKIHNGFKTVKTQQIRKLVANLLKALDVDLFDPNFRETPRRYADVLIERFGKNIDIQYELESFSNAVFPCKSTELVAVKDINVFSVCPHHLLTVEYDIIVGYIPNGYAVGLSKLARICKILASFPRLQEDLTQDIADTLQKYINTEDVMVIVKGRHLCMISRGIDQVNSKTVSSAIRGVFQTEGGGANPREEMLKLVSKTV